MSLLSIPSIETNLNLPQNTCLPEGDNGGGEGNLLWLCGPAIPSISPVGLCYAHMHGGRYVSQSTRASSLQGLLYGI